MKIHILIGIIVVNANLTNAIEERYMSNAELAQQAITNAFSKTSESIKGKIGNGILFLENEKPEESERIVENAILLALVSRSFSVKDQRSEDATYRLSFRTEELNIFYINQDRGKIKRECKARILFVLSERKNGNILLVVESTGEAFDFIPRSALPGLEYSSSKSLRTIFLAEKESGWKRIFEPIVITGVIGGLIYLFYASRAAK